MKKFQKNLFFVRVYNENGNEIVNETFAGYEGDDFVTNGTRIKWSDGDNFCFFQVKVFKDGLNSAVYVPVNNLNESNTNIFGIIDFNFNSSSISL